MQYAKGEGIFVSYTDPLQTTLQRRTFLEKGLVNYTVFQIQVIIP